MYRGFSIDGVQSSTLGLYLAHRRTITGPERSLNITDVPTAEKPVISDLGGAKGHEEELELIIMDAANVSAAFAFLSGIQRVLVDGDTPTLAETVTFIGAPAFTPTGAAMNCGKISVEMLVDPYRAVVPAAANITKTTSDTPITNPGTAASAPKITINGSGTFSVTISNGTTSKTLFFENVPSGGIMYDSELKDALSPDGTVLMTQYMQYISDFDFTIPPGESTVSWDEAAADAEEGITAGHVTSVTITPRWRCL